MDESPLRIGIMGFGLIGRSLYKLAAESADVVVPVVSDVAEPETLHYLLTAHSRNDLDARLDGNHLEVDRFSTRMVKGIGPESVPWDAFGVDAVVEATGRYASTAAMADHIESGAPRVFLSTLPETGVDRLVLPGINLETIDPADRTVSVGSATTGALAYVLEALTRRFAIRAATMTTIRAYSSDQSLQDRATGAPRRSRSAAENIIPNDSETPRWIETLMPRLAGKLSGTALNVPVQKGALLDTTLMLEEDSVSAERVNETLAAFAEEHPLLARAVTDPIVSSDVLGTSESAIFDLAATLAPARHTLKTLTWYDTGVPQASRILEVIRAYAATPAAPGSP